MNEAMGFREPRDLIVCVALALISAFAPLVCTGQGILLNHPGQFYGPTTLLDFERSGDGQPLPQYSFPGISNQWLNAGVYIVDSTPEDGVARFRSTGGDQTPTYSGTNGLSEGGISGASRFIEYRFMATPSLQGVVTEAGIWAINSEYSGSGPSLITFFDRMGNPIDSVTSNGRYFFGGYRYEDGISAIRISDPDYFLTDNLYFSAVTPVPEPGTWALLIGGSAVLCALTTRKRR